MKKLWFALVALIGLPLAAVASGYEEGVHYEVISGQATQSPEVIEFFSFYCGHCWHFEPTAARLTKEIQGAEFTKAHVEFLGRGKAGQIMTRGYAVSLVLKVEKAFSEAVFKRHFVERNYIQSEDGLRDVFVSIGVSAKDFDSAYNSFPTNSIVARMAKKTRTYGINATPSVIVNGKYKVKASGIAKADSPEDEYIKLVNYLLTLN